MTLHCGLIGDPVEHSISPDIHHAFAAQTGVDLKYRKLRCNSDELAATVEQFFAEGGRGLNVTLPHKLAVMALCSDVSQAAQRAQSVNTLYARDGGGVEGSSTDGDGLVADLRRLGAPLSGARIALIGAGGAARAVVEPLLSAQPAELVWSHRNPLKLEQPVADFAGLGPLRPCANLALKGDRFDLVIHATSAGHAGQVPMLPHGLFADGGWAYDLSYGQPAQPYLNWAEGEGAARVIDGHGMLIEQAALSFALWTGQHPDTAPLHR